MTESKDRIEPQGDNPRSNDPAAPDFESGTLLSDKNNFANKTEAADPTGTDGKIGFSDIFQDKKPEDGLLKRLGSQQEKSRTNTDELGPLLDRNPLGLTLKDDAGLSKASSFSLKGDLSKLDFKKPTIAFLDDTSDKAVTLDGKDMSHAHLSAIAAQKSGFNALVLDTSGVEKAADTFYHAYKSGDRSKAIDKTIAELDKNGLGTMGLDKLDKKDFEGAAKILIDHKFNFAKPINELADKIEKGELPMGKGDVLNVSMGNNAEKDEKGNFIPGTGDPTFSELSKKLGFEVNAENLSENKERILKKLEDISKDASDPEWQSKGRRALETNNAIGRLQSLGVEVAHSASNDGNDRVDINFLRANHELESVNPANGTKDKFSGAGNREANGVVPIYRQSDGNGNPAYKISGKEFSKSELAALNGDFSLFSAKDPAEPDKISVFKDELPAEKTALDKEFTKLVGRNSPELKTAAGNLAAIAVGNSFANIEFFQRNLDRLRAKKQDASSLRF